MRVIILLTIAVMAMASCTGNTREGGSTGAFTNASPETKSNLAAKPEVSKLVIVHFNDTHSQILPFKNAGGLEEGGISKRAAFIRDMRSKESNLLVLDAGDFMTGSVYCTLFKGEFDIELLNRVGYSAATPGNHEFDNGLERALWYRDHATFPFLSANAYTKAGKPLFTPYIVTNIAGLKLVIIGLSCTENMVYNRSVADNVDFRSEFVTLSNLVYGLGLKKTNDRIICLTHVGYMRDIELARSIPEIDWIFGGHSHTLLNKPFRMKDTLVMQAGDLGRQAGVLELFFSNKLLALADYRIAPLNYKFTNTDTEIDRLIASKEEGIREKMDEKLSEMEINLVKPALGNLLADMIKEAAGADIGIVNSGGIRANLNRGPLLVRDLYNLYPFDNALVTCQMKGSLIKAVLTRDATGKGGGLFYSKGLNAIFQGGTITASLSGTALSDNQEYTVAISDFIYNGGDGYIEFKEAKGLYNTQKLVRDALIEGFRKIPAVNHAVIDEIPRLTKR